MDVYTYNAIYQLETHHWWFVGRRSYVKNLLSRAFAGRDSLKLCEMGCGSGGNFKMLAGLGKIDAMEMDINTFQRAKTRGEEIKNVENVYCIRLMIHLFLPQSLRATRFASNNHQG